MYCKMTTFGYWATLALCAKDIPIHQALSEEVERLSPARVMVNAPYAAWKFAYRRLYETNFGPRGARRVYGKTAVHLALKQVTKELNYIDTHPAMQGLGMFGIETEIFPAWKIESSEDSTRSRYSPYPQPGHQFVVLVPKWQEHPMKPKLTWWVPGSGEGRLSHEESHLSLWRREVA